jgi:hypothetical protein
MVLLSNPEAARSYPCGRIALGFCQKCGFIANLAFQPELTRYDGVYEASQAFSHTFNAFHTQLARRLINDYDLRGKTSLEIGCGEGDFLSLLCDLGSNKGIGFDPSFVPSRLRAPLHPNTEILADFYSDRYSGLHADFVCCKMTLEHIPAPAQFLRGIRAAATRNPQAVVFFQIPNAARTLEDAAFWDVYYEHCSYFTPAALVHLFECSGFEVLAVQTEYEGQYLSVAAKPSPLPPKCSSPGVGQEPAALVNTFAQRVNASVDGWNNRLRALRNQKVVLWGGGSKAVGFLSSLQNPDQIKIAVDINPFRQQKYLPPFGQRVAAPAVLASYNPDAVIVMNPIYKEEIRRELAMLCLAPALLTT